MIRTAKAWKVRPSELIDISDPYTAYCFDSACAYMLENILHNRLPTFPGSKTDDDGKKRTTNSLLIAEMQKANKRR